MKKIILIIMLISLNANGQEEKEESTWACGIKDTPRCEVIGEKIEKKEEDITYIPVAEIIREIKEGMREYIDPTIKFFPTNSECPIVELKLKNNFSSGIFNEDYKINSHCEILEENRELIKFTLEISWLVMAIGIILRT